MATSNPEIHLVRDGVLYDHTGRRVCDLDIEAGGHTAWRQWIRNPKNISFNFESKLIPGLTFTVVSETRPSRSGTGRLLTYWYAAKHVNSILLRQYAGSSKTISITTLERAARKMSEQALEDAAPDAETRQAWQTARRKSLRRRRPAPRREMPEEPQPPAGQQLGLW